MWYMFKSRMILSGTLHSQWMLTVESSGWYRIALHSRQCWRILEAISVLTISKRPACGSNFSGPKRFKWGLWRKQRWVIDTTFNKFNSLFESKSLQSIQLVQQRLWTRSVTTLSDLQINHFTTYLLYGTVGKHLQISMALRGINELLDWT